MGDEIDERKGLAETRSPREKGIESIKDLHRSDVEGRRDRAMSGRDKATSTEKRSGHVDRR